jgi:Zn finger protein HypA/HybF involved in hydrogenase expression
MIPAQKPQTIFFPPGAKGLFQCQHPDGCTHKSKKSYFHDQERWNCPECGMPMVKVKKEDILIDTFNGKVQA